MQDKSGFALALMALKMGQGRATTLAGGMAHGMVPGVVRLLAGMAAMQRMADQVTNRRRGRLPPAGRLNCLHW